MASLGVVSVTEHDAAVEPLDQLRSSARGWHGAQLAVLGFIGLCGVLHRGATEENPGWLRWFSLLLVLLALVLACVATVLVALVAWPLHVTSSDAQATTATRVVEKAGRRLRTGIAATFVAVALVALATSTSWWPTEQRPECEIEVHTRAGVVCGELLDG